MNIKSKSEFTKKGIGYKKVSETPYYTVWSLCSYDDDTQTLHRYGYEVWSGDRHYKCPTSADKDIRIQKVLQEYLQNIQS